MHIRHPHLLLTPNKRARAVSKEPLGPLGPLKECSKLRSSAELQFPKIFPGEDGE
jgi:hypothetical protein